MILGEPLKKAIEAKRIHHQLEPMQLEYEIGFNADAVAAFKDEGHRTVKVDLENGFYAVNAISIDPATNIIFPFADPRRRGGGFY